MSLEVLTEGQSHISDPSYLSHRWSGCPSSPQPVRHPEGPHPGTLYDSHVPCNRNLQEGQSLQGPKMWVPGSGRVSFVMKVIKCIAAAWVY